VFSVQCSAPPLATEKPVKSKKKLYSFIRELRVTDLAHPSVRPRRRSRPRPRMRIEHSPHEPPLFEHEHEYEKNQIKSHAYAPDSAG